MLLTNGHSFWEENEGYTQAQKALNGLAVVNNTELRHCLYSGFQQEIYQQEIKLAI